MTSRKTLKRAFSDLFSDRFNQLLLFFGIEGFLYQFVVSMAGSGGFGTNLYATNLGATDSQIGMIQLVSNLAAAVMLLPLGLLADRTKNAKAVPIVLMLIMSATYILYGSIPAMGGNKMVFFFLLLPFTAGMLALYNAIWQAFFGDVTRLEERNRIYTLRNRAVYLVATITPLACGALLTAMPDSAHKLIVLRVFFYVCAAFNLLNAWILSKVPGGARSAEQLARLPKVSARSVTQTVRALAHDRRFLTYFIPVILFYMTWHFDWSMWYIGETQYIGMNEAELSVYTALVSVAQLLMMGLFSRRIARKGTDSTFIGPMLSLICCPIFMFFSSTLPESLRPAAFIVLGTILCAPQAATNLCLVQMLLNAAPEENRSLVISFNMICVTLSNALLPFLGVQLYTLLGADVQAFRAFLGIDAGLRVLSLFVYVAVLQKKRRGGPKNAVTI